ncbi:MAG: prepilin-type N-terminal cleavage/methylation domain-containing protein [Candidatus Hydrogenedentes bacterium]|nr:prepilin-type N-terminal cleavage/methylation domain-containing protein [Candidatus Hydrogenedentota bacterium]
MQCRCSGFTLVELIIVIIILAIIAALAIPQFTSSTEEAKQAVLDDDLATMQKAIDRYFLEHGENYPDSQIVNQLTQYTRGDGTPNANFGPPFKLGPYLNAIPPNPFASGSVDADGITVVSDNDPLVADASPTTGWKYNSTTGRIIANVS